MSCHCQTAHGLLESEGTCPRASTRLSFVNCWDTGGFLRGFETGKFIVRLWLLEGTEVAESCTKLAAVALLGDIETEDCEYWGPSKRAVEAELALLRLSCCMPVALNCFDRFCAANEGAISAALAFLKFPFIFESKSTLMDFGMSSTRPRWPGLKSAKKDL